MKLHLFDHGHHSMPALPRRYESLVYGTALIAGIPVVVISLNFLIDAFFRLLR